MFLPFLHALRQAGIPVSIREHLTLLEALSHDLGTGSLDDFYHLSRTVLIKHEQHFDRFDRVFAHCTQGLALELEDLQTAIPEEWLRKQIEKYLSEEEKQQLNALPWQELMDTLRQRLAEQHERHQGGNKWIGTGGTSPFGAYGYNPAGIRIGQDGSRHRHAVKVWDKREFRDLDGEARLNKRNLQMALRRMREFAREGASEVLNLPQTIRDTASNGGMLKLAMERERHNSTKLVVLFDIGGSMDDHIHACEALFGAIRLEFKHLEFYYFHNCPYESLWQENKRRHDRTTPTSSMLNTYGSDYKLLIIGDACMSPYEIAYPGGSVEHMNEESGQVWLQRILAQFPRAAWINPLPETEWRYYQSVDMIQKIMQNRMFSLSTEGLDKAAACLRQPVHASKT